MSRPAHLIGASLIVGVLIAAVLASAYMGGGFAALAIVASALAVATGFGLRNLLGDFAAGIILQIGRAIKVGDLVETRAGEGEVRRIGARTSEIETPDRATLIIANSRLIAGEIVNRTREDRSARLVVRLGVAHQSEPETVQGVLLGVAGRHPGVLSSPPPAAFFEEFGASALVFSLVVHVGDVGALQTVRSELNGGILLALRSAGIEIAYPQSDVHLRDLDFVKAALARFLAERERTKADAASKGENA